MPRYMLFAKTKSFKYTFKGAYNGKTGNEAIKKARGMGASITTKMIVIAIPSSKFMSHQLNPKKTRGKMGVSTNWRKPK